MASETPSSTAIVILNWNGKKYLEQFLPSVLQNSAGCEVIVADNASTDDSVAFLQQHYPQVRLIRHEVNLGFCGGYNEALKQVNSKFYVLLNSDVEVTPNWAQPVIELMEQDEQIAACQPKIKAFHQPDYFEYAGAGGGYIDSLGYPFCRGRIFDDLEKDKGQYNDVREVFWATGACMFVRASAYQELGGLEENFFAHMEEIDLCWRFHNAGYKVYYCGKSEVYHVGGGTLHKSNPRKTYLNFRNGLSLLYRNLPDKQLNTTIFKRMVLDGVAAAKMMASGQLKDTQAIYKAHQDFKKVKPLWLQKRTEQPDKKPLTSLPGTYKGSIVWDYFVGKKKTFAALQVPDGAPLTA
ncbi:MAG: glycosyltransferase family 2 protein [Hymenobacteraceae bacterium]|nr:glycosyltransferase family 2 protein [Hymenobacteraceae bacterium]MDX5395132.1 glycosyltransferase family 2 protein [Hymenobacteraceae bacterium]MDX5511173.1 glycosyltransferase family 2 protein [Hymenobacteraceae bacterium]